MKRNLGFGPQTLPSISSCQGGLDYLEAKAEQQRFIAFQSLDMSGVLHGVRQTKKIHAAFDAEFVPFYQLVVCFYMYIATLEAPLCYKQVM